MSDEVYHKLAKSLILYRTDFLQLIVGLRSRF